MWPRWLVPRFSIRTLLLAVAGIAVGLWAYLYLPDILHNRQDRLSRAAIDPYELSIAGNGDPAKAPPELVAILGDSRLKHWWRIGEINVFSRDRFISSGMDEVARVWDLTSGRQVRQFYATSATVSRDGSKAFVALSDGRIEVWDLVGDKRLGELHGHPGKSISLATSKDGKVLVSIAVERSRPGQLPPAQAILWDSSTFKPISELPELTEHPSAVAMSDAGNRVAVSASETITVYDLPSGEKRAVIGPLGDGQYTYNCYNISFFQDDKFVVTGDAAGHIELWNAADGSHVEQVDLGANSSIHGLSARQNIVVSDGDRIRMFMKTSNRWANLDTATLNGVHFYDVDSNLGWTVASESEHSLHAWTSRKPARFPGGIGAALRCLAFSPNGRFLATGDAGGEITIWRTSSWREVRNWKADPEMIKDIAYSPDSAMLVSRSDFWEFVLWDAETGKELNTIRRSGWSPLAFSPDSQWIAGEDQIPAGTVIRTWKVADGKVGVTIPAPGKAQHGGLAYSPDGKKIIRGSAAHTITIADLNTNAATGLGAQTVNVTPIAVHPDGQRVVATGNRGKGIEVWDINAQKLLAAVKPRPKGMVRSVAIHPKGKWVASAADDGTTSIWEIDSGVVLKTWQLGPPKGVVFQVAFSPDGRYLATVNGNGTAYLLRLDWIAGLKP